MSRSGNRVRHFCVQPKPAGDGQGSMDRLLFLLLFHQTVFLPRTLFTARALCLVLILMTRLQCFRELLGAGQGLLLRATRHTDSSLLMDCSAILSDEFGRQRQFLCAEVTERGQRREL